MKSLDIVRQIEEICKMSNLDARNFFLNSNMRDFLNLEMSMKPEKWLNATSIQKLTPLKDKEKIRILVISMTFWGISKDS
jgi:hypothetical protein